GRCGVALLEDLSDASLGRIVRAVGAARRPGDVAVVSLHWGGNWDFDVPQAQRAFARALIEMAGVDVVHGHSSHHVKGIEVHRGRPILYGCGDFLDDYEGIGGYGAFRGELGAMYFVTLDAADGRLLALDLVPTRIHRFRIGHARGADRRWLLRTLQRECGRFGCEVRDAGERGFALGWGAGAGA
ncbi:MAG TPA: CapA family protein, partial [Luteimonas sp.]|nr:CapA family protein [Luteimonas sp.]